MQKKKKICQCPEDGAPERKCGRPVMARGMCSTHYRREERAAKGHEFKGQVSYRRPKRVSTAISLEAAKELERIRRATRSPSDYDAAAMIIEAFCKLFKEGVVPLPTETLPSAA
jgi:hypothetical protein